MLRIWLSAGLDRIERPTEPPKSSVAAIGFDKRSDKLHYRLEAGSRSWPARKQIAGRVGLLLGDEPIRPFANRPVHTILRPKLWPPDDIAPVCFNVDPLAQSTVTGAGKLVVPEINMQPATSCLVRPCMRIR